MIFRKQNRRTAVTWNARSRNLNEEKKARPACHAQKEIDARVKKWIACFVQPYSCAVLLGTLLIVRCSVTSLLLTLWTELTGPGLASYPGGHCCAYSVGVRIFSSPWKNKKQNREHVANCLLNMGLHEACCCCWWCKSCCNWYEREGRLIDWGGGGNESWRRCRFSAGLDCGHNSIDAATWPSRLRLSCLGRRPGWPPMIAGNDVSKEWRITRWRGRAFGAGGKKKCTLFKIAAC